MDSKTLDKKIKAFKLRVDDDKEFINLPLEDFVKEIALTVKEKREAKQLMDLQKGL